MTFTNATDQGGRDQGEHFVCSEVLTFPDAGATTCYFATASQIVADASAAPGLEGGTNVVLPYGKLRKACDWERCECDFFNPGGQASAEVPSGVQQPVAMLQGPQEAAAQSCDGTEVSAAPSTGHLGRPFESYVWTAVAADRWTTTQCWPPKPGRWTRRSSTSRETTSPLSAPMLTCGSM